MGTMHFQAANAAEDYCPPGAKFCPAPGSGTAYADESSFGYGSYPDMAAGSDGTNSYFESQLNEGERLIMVAPSGYDMGSSEIASPASPAPVGSYAMPSSSFASPSYSDYPASDYSSSGSSSSLGGMSFMPPPPGSGSSSSSAMTARSEPVSAPPAPVARSLSAAPAPVPAAAPAARTLFQDSHDGDADDFTTLNPMPAMASVSEGTSRKRPAARQAAQSNRSAIASRSSTTTHSPSKAKVYTVIDDGGDDDEDYGDLPSALSGRDFQSDRDTYSDRGSFREEKEKLHPYQNKPAKQKVRRADMLSEVANETSRRPDKGVDMKPRPENRVPWWKGGVWRNRDKSKRKDVGPEKTRAEIKAEREAAKKAAKEAKRNGKD